MKCTYCGKEINTSNEKYDLFGCDGDFIHEKCKDKQYKQMDKVCSMTDEEFGEWILGN